MFTFVSAPWQRCGLLLLALVLLAGCSSLSASPASQTSPTSPASPTPTATAQTAFTTYVGKWQVHDTSLTISADKTGLLQWNAGPCSDAGAMCNGNAQVVFTENADGSIQGTIQSVTYTQWSGDPAPAGYQPDAEDPQAGDIFQLQHNKTHLLYTTWFGAASDLNNGNRYWCDSYALSAGWQECGA